MKKNDNFFRINFVRMTFIYASLGLLLQAFIVNFVFAVTPSNAQNLDKTIVNINLVNKSLGRVFNEIEGQTNYRFSYVEGQIPLKTSTTLHANGTPLNDVLNELASQHNLTFEIIKNQIVVQREKVVIVENAGEKGKIKGVIVDAASGEALIGANIIIQGTSLGAATDIDGKFVLPAVEPGNYTVKVSYVGYKDKIERITVVPNRTTEITITLSWIAVEGDEVLVTAQARGQLSAINEQLSATEIKNVVSKDRIRELPDANAAESVGRLPGISLARSGGEGYGVVIRGLQPKYSKIMIDGVALSATGGTDRTVSMSSISSYSLEGIEVIKSPTADMDGDQVGGSVNLVMRTAPKGLRYELIAEGGYKGLRNSVTDYNFVGSASNRFFENKLGIFTQLTVDQKNMGSNNMYARYDPQSNQEVGAKNSIYLNGITLANTFVTRKRLGGTLTLDYLLPNGKIYFKNFLSSSKSNNQYYGEDFGKAQHLYTTEDYEYNRLMFSNILGVEEYILGFNVKAKLSHTYTSGETPKDITFEFLHEGGMKNHPTDILPEEVPSYKKPDSLTNNGFDWVWKNAYDDSEETISRQIMGKIDFEKEFEITKQLNGKIKFGVKFRYDEHSQDKERYYSDPRYAGGDIISALDNGIDRFRDAINKQPNPEKIAGSTTFGYPLFYDHNFSHGEFLDGAFQMGPVADIGFLNTIINLLREKHKELGDVDGYRYYHFTSNINDYSGLERLGAGYLMAEVNLTKNLTFIPGIRYEAKNTSYSGVYGHNLGLAELGFIPKDTTSNRNNDFWLPMIHLRYEPFEWLQVRMAYTKTIARPNFTDIIPNMYWGVNTITMRNPNLVPELAESFDLYFAFSDNHLGLLTLGGFWKNIKDKIFSRGVRVLLNPEEYNLDPEKYPSGRFRFSTQENNKTISVSKGVEIDWQTNFWYLPSFLKGFVLNVNYTKIFSETVYPKTEIKQIGRPPFSVRDTTIDRSYTDRLQDQPSDIFNIALGYDYKDFSCRLSMNYQTDVFKQSNFWPEFRTSTDALMLWDFSVKQKLPWAGLQLYCNIVNLSGAIEKTHFLYGKQREQNTYGRTAVLGLIWRMDGE